ncbi:type II and III secretion system protein family protein [Rugamonas sp. DEMB1]|uniref:type II and III secretion system protein family protein n=1 Tax=Rugamonas sp. DEMB1 TaxID=3039386 RepID=UPI00244B345D|nr:type II and III secretion system protein family protein [Rugamonas sp. DEMB1]WGG50274.1 type II and III secretion system protein family protein [Rugamonas sp. DEMB1]
MSAPRTPARRAARLAGAALCLLSWPALGAAVSTAPQQASAVARAAAPDGAAPGAAQTAAAQGAGRPAPSAASGPRCAGQAAAPGSLALALGKSTLMRLPDTVLSRSVGNPEVLQAMLVAPDTLYLVGADVGSTNLIVQGRNGQCSVVEVTVAMDGAGLQAALAALLPEERNIRVSAAADTLVLSGSVADAGAVAHALELAGAFVRRPAKALQLGREGREGRDGKDGDKAEAAPATAGGARVINLLSVSAPQQVMLEVKIAEVSKSLLDKLEGNATLRFASGSFVATLLSNFFTGTMHSAAGLGRAGGNHGGLAAEKQDGLVRILAEPTVMAVSGQEGSFLAGGKIFIPVAQDNNKVTLEEKEFGVGLRFTPTVLSGGRINLKVAPEVSELSREGVGISAAGFTGAAVLPLITTRRAATTVQLFDGQSFAIGGLIKNNQVSNIRALPLLGELPVLGALFRSSDFQQDRSELLFVVTAHLVKPLPPNYALPTDSVAAPSRARLFLGGRLEGPAAPPAPAVQPTAAQGFELK